MADLHVSKKNIEKLFNEMQGRKFIIPDFQRPYKWNIEKCETLWEDIEHFTNTDAKSGADYFLGTIVSYINDDKNQEIIDGQQRITSFFLLLRAFFRKLEDMPQDDQVIGLKNKVAPCIWDTDRFSGKVTDFSSIHIASLVATEEDNDTFHRILETGESNPLAMDNYSKNYRFFKEKCDSYASSNPMQWKELCVTILTQCIILPIECDTPETALTIFSTLNDRGLPLADSDIFKAQIYRSLTTQQERTDFTTTWKELSKICKQGNLTIDEIFRYYSHVLRARNNDKSKEVGLRKFYADQNYARLRRDDLMDDIIKLAHFWRYLNTEIDPDEGLLYTISLSAKKSIQCLSHYPNEFWKYATSVFFLKNKNSETFEEEFEVFLSKLLAFLITKFISAPTVNAIKDDVYNSCIEIENNNRLQFRLNWNRETIVQDIKDHDSSRISRALLLMDAYLNPNQVELIPKIFDVEHIFPKVWQNTNYNGWTKPDADKYLDYLGNKTVLEKKINIQAGNGYFGKKKEKYLTSLIANAQDLGVLEQNDWLINDIEDRQKRFTERIVDFLEVETQVSN